MTSPAKTSTFRQVRVSEGFFKSTRSNEAVENFGIATLEFSSAYLQHFSSKCEIPVVMNKDNLKIYFLKSYILFFSKITGQLGVLNKQNQALGKGVKEKEMSNTVCACRVSSLFPPLDVTNKIMYFVAINCY